MIRKNEAKAIDGEEVFIYKKWMMLLFSPSLLYFICCFLALPWLLLVLSFCFSQLLFLSNTFPSLQSFLPYFVSSLPPSLLPSLSTPSLPWQ